MMNITAGSIYLDRKKGVNSENRRFIVPVSDLGGKIVKCVAWRESDGVPSFTTIARTRLANPSQYKLVDINDL
jgi:hypothetical protein